MIPKLGHDEAMHLAETELARMVQLLRQLDEPEWQKQTVCDLWDVRAMVAHVVGMAARRPRSASSCTTSAPRPGAAAAR